MQVTEKMKRDLADDGAIAVLTINRPHRRNALDSQTLTDMHRLLDGLNGDPALRAIVMTGTGVSFCSGADLKSQPDDLADSAGVAYAELRSAATSTVAVTMAAQELMASAFERANYVRTLAISTQFRDELSD